jgi:hypothetical protein
MSADEIARRRTVAALIGAGVLERFPRLRVSFGERAASAGCPMRSTAWISNTRIASAI